MLSGLVVWIDPNEPVQLSGSNVSLTGDQAGLGNQAGQNNPGQMPTLVTLDSAINRRSSIRYDGLDDFLEIADNPSIDFSNQFSAHLLVKPSVIAVNKTMLAKWDYQTQGSWAFQTDFSTSDELMFAPALNITDPGNQKVVSSDANMLLSEPAVLNLEYDGTQLLRVKFLKNNTLLSSFVVNSIPSSLPNSTATLKIGKYGGIATRYYQGDIGEIIIYNRVLNSAEKVQLMEYYRSKYAPPVSLGNDTLISSNSFCGNLTLRGQYRFKSYLWSTGATSSSIQVTSPGVYWVTATDYFGNTSTDSIMVYPPFNLNVPPSDQLCANTTMTWAPDYDPALFNYSWSTGATSPSLTISQAGTYFVTITDGFGCSYQTDPITVSIDNYEYFPYLGADTSLCTGNFLSLQYGASQTVNYLWPDGSTAAQFAVNAPGTYWVQTSNANGCIARDTILISIAGTAPNAEFSVTDHCFNKLVPMLDQSSGVGADFVAQWQWNMGNGTVLNQQAPNYTYPAPGAYPVQLYVQSIGGCGAYHYDTVIVFANPGVSYNVVGHCEDQEVIFTNTSSAGSAAISSYTWDFDMPWTGAYNTSNIPIPNRVFEQVGNYDVKLVVTDVNGCKDSLIQTVVIDPSPVPNFIFESTCQGTPIQFINTSATQPSSTYLWEFGDNTSSILVNPQHTYPDYGLQQVVLNVTNLYGCTASNLQEVEVYAFPEVSMQIGSACVDSYVSLENTSLVPLGAIDSTLWVINQTDTLYGLNSAWMVDAFGQQQVELFTWSAQGCASQSSQFFDVTTQFNADFTTGTGIIAVGQPFTFENTSTPGSIALWTFGDGGFSTEYSPEHTFSSAYADSSLEVMLIALDPSGCVDTSMQTVLIRRARIDLEIANLFLQKDGNWYTMGVSLTNKGTVNIESADLVVETQKGLLFNETWHGSLEPTEDSVYVFSAMPTSIFNEQDNIEAYICVSGVGFDLYNTAETYLENNRVCRNVEGEGIVLLPVFPNPATGDFNVRIFLTNPAEVYLSLDDSRGRSVVLLENNTTLQDGYYQYNVDADRLAEGIYYIHLRSGEETRTFRLSVIK